MKAIPPTISCFQDIKRTTSKINVGILCINSAPIVCQKLSSGEKTSKDIKAKKIIKIIDSILGVQNMKRLIDLGFFFIIRTLIIQSI